MPEWDEGAVFVALLGSEREHCYSRLSIPVITVSCLVDRVAGRLAVMVVLLCLLMPLYVMLFLVSKHYLEHDAWYKHPDPSVRPLLIMDEMVVLMFVVSNMLTKLNISHALCYGTLWGALRCRRTLPWDNNVDFCVEEKIQVSWDGLHQTFKVTHTGMTYDLHQGEYLVTWGPAQSVHTVFLSVTVRNQIRWAGAQVVGLFSQAPSVVSLQAAEGTI